MPSVRPTKRRLLPTAASFAPECVMVTPTAIAIVVTPRFTG
jgi:hypothetical protein